MNDDIKRIISNLVFLYGEEELSSIIKFAVYFRCDDLKLYDEFKSKVRPRGILQTNDLITLLAKRYNLDPKKDMSTIRDMYVNNVFNNGYVYHMTSKANASSIDETGLNPRYNEEQEDIKRVRGELTPKGESNFFPFAKDDYNKLYYSRTLNIGASYGLEPEWIRELNKQFRLFDTYAASESEQAKKDLKELRVKYNEKYKDRSRVLYLIPASYTMKGKRAFTSEDLDNINLKPEEVIGRFERIVKSSINESITSYVPRTSLVCIDLSNGKILESNQEKITM